MGAPDHPINISIFFLTRLLTIPRRGTLYSMKAVRPEERGTNMHDLAPLIVFSTIAWIAWMIFSTIRRYQIAKFQTSVQMRLMEKIDSSQTLLSYVETEGGKRFLDTLAVE